MTDEAQTREDRALDALITACMRFDDPERPVTQHEIDSFVRSDAGPSEYDRQVLEGMTLEDVMSRIRSGTRQRGASALRVAEEVQSELYAAMNRKSKDDNLDEKTRKELERKRRELLGHNWEDENRKAEGDGKA